MNRVVVRTALMVCLIIPPPAHAAESLFVLAESSDVEAFMNTIVDEFGVDYDLVDIVDTVRDGNGWSLIHRAAMSNNTTLVEHFLSVGVPPDLKAGAVSATSLHMAIRANATNTVLALLDHDASWSSLDLNERSPLEWAYLFRDVGLLDLLLQRGADPNAPFARIYRSLDRLGANIENTEYSAIIDLFDAYGFDEEYHRSLRLQTVEPLDGEVMDGDFGESGE